MLSALSEWKTQTSEASLCEAKGARVRIKGFLPAYPWSYWIPLAVGSCSVFDLTYEGASVLLVVVLKCRWNELRPCKCWWTAPRPCRASGHYEAGGNASWLESHWLWDSKTWWSRQWSFVQEVSRWWKAGQTAAERSLRGVMGRTYKKIGRGHVCRDWSPGQSLNSLVWNSVGEAQLILSKRRPKWSRNIRLSRMDWRGVILSQEVIKDF